MRNIVIGVDGSDASHKALSWAEKLVASQSDVRFHLVHGYTFPIAHAEAAHIYAQELDRAQEAGRLLLNEASERLKGEQVHVHLRSEPPATAMVTVAEQVGANLVAVGRRGLSPAASLFLGGVSSAVMQNADAPVLVVHDAPVRSVRRILVGVDGSACSARALAFAAHWRNSAEVVAIYVNNSDADATEVAKAVITKTANRAEIDPAEITMLGRVGNAADEVLAELKSGDYDLAVIGSRGRGPLATVVLGSVSERLTRLATTAVVVVK